MEQPTLDEARIKFPIGTKFNNKNLGLKCDNIEITGTHFYKSTDGNILVGSDSSKRKGYNSSSFTVYKDGVWAEITNSTEPNYEIY